MNKKTKKHSEQSNKISSGAALLIGGSLLGIIGTMQDNDNIKLLVVGFASALLVMAGVILYLAAKYSAGKSSAKKKK